MLSQNIFSRKSMIRVEPTQHFVVSDSYGFVGAFHDIADVWNLKEKYHLVPFIIQRFKVSPGPTDAVWVVLYRANDAVAFVSNVKEEAEEAQRTFNTIGLSYEDNIDFWKQPVNKVIEPAEDRLESISRAHKMYANVSPEDFQTRSDEDLKRIEELLKPSENGPLQRFLKETEKISIIDHVIPISLGGPSDPEQCSPDEPQHPDDEPQHPDDEPQHPDDKPQHPDDEPQHPDDEPQHPDMETPD